MKREELIEQVLTSDELPTLPIVASKLITLTSQEETTLTDIASLVSKDISLSSKVLKVSNSAFYSFPQQIGSINQAVSILGTNAVRSLVLSFSFLSIKGGKKSSYFNFEKFWERALASAVASKLILEKVKGADTEEIFISGLLQNLGELVLIRTFPEEYEKVLASTASQMLDSIDVEETVFEANHCDIGYAVAKSWGFPEVLLQPILHHHAPEGYTGGDKKIELTTKAVYLSDILINILFSDKPEEYHKQFKKQAKSLLALRPEDVENILDDVHLQVEQAGEYFGLKIKNTKSVQEILQEANIRLGLLNLDYDQINKQLIATTVELQNLTRELEEKNRVLDNLAHIDGLTNVYNHRYLQNTLDEEINRTIRNEGILSIVLADIDFFKKFNDTYGHQTGDFILIEFCRILKDNLRQYDTLARYGGEEFAIVLPETTNEDALAVSEKLRAAIEATHFDDGRETYRVTSSFGVATAKPAIEDTFNKNIFIERADKALYDAKAQGRNQVASYTEKKKWYKF